LLSAASTWRRWTVARTGEFLRADSFRTNDAPLLRVYVARQQQCATDPEGDDDAS
jgi:hypothetical protein